MAAERQERLGTRQAATLLPSAGTLAIILKVAA